MLANKVSSVLQIKLFVTLIICISSSCCLNIGLTPRDMKRLSPVVIKKYSQNSPVFINIKSEGQPQKGEFLRKLPAKPPPRNIKRALPELKPSKKLRRSIPPLPLVPLVVSLIPRTPLFPLFPNWIMPPVITESPLNPSPIAKLSNMVSWTKRNHQVLDKLMELKHRGSLTTAEYIKFKNLLL